VTSELVPLGSRIARQLAVRLGGAHLRPRTGDRPPAPPVRPGLGGTASPSSSRRLRQPCLPPVCSGSATVRWASPPPAASCPSSASTPPWSADAEHAAAPSPAMDRACPGLSSGPRQHQRRLLRRGHQPPQLRRPRRLAGVRRRALGDGVIHSPLTSSPARAQTTTDCSSRRRPAVLTRHPAPQGVRACPRARP
jgi:hypothetical protein